MILSSLKDLSNFKNHLWNQYSKEFQSTKFKLEELNKLPGWTSK